MPRIFANVVLLALPVGCSFDFAHKTACESQSDCLDGYVCQANLCTSPTPGGSTAGAAGALPAYGNDRPAAAGTDSVAGGGSAGAGGPVAMGGTSGSVGGASGAEGGTGGAEGGAGDVGGEGGAGAPGCVEPSKTAEVAYLLHPHPTMTSIRFGKAVAVDGDTLVVDAFRDEAVFVFVKTECGWSFQAELRADDAIPDMNFGNAVAIRGDTVAVGAPLAGVIPSTGGDSIQAGAVYVFKRSGSTWTQTAKLQAHNADAYDQFGISVAMDGDAMAIGASGEDSASRTINSGSDDNSLESDGAAYVFSRAGAEWAESAYLKRDADGSNGYVSGGMGVSVALSGTHVVVGAPGTLASGVTDAGAAYVFSEDSGVFTLEQTLWVRKPLTATEARSGFGTTVAVSGDTVAVGAPNYGEDTGAAHGTVSLFSYLGKGYGWYAGGRLGGFARNGNFGASLALGPGRLIVGDSAESNAGQGIDAAQSQQVSAAAGAAYLFDLDPNTWRLELTHYIKASNAGQVDRFGDSVALSGDVFVVGAPERHSAPEDLYPPMDKYRYGPGASYVFKIVP